MKHQPSSQLKQGIKVELEHAHLFPKNLRKYMAEKIAKDHLREDSKYYSKLKRVGLWEMAQWIKNILGHKVDIIHISKHDYKVEIDDIYRLDANSVKEGFEEAENWIEDNFKVNNFGGVF